ncbi:MAG TPA: alpha/beta hydrolase [Chitinophagaceae bacterium]|nr:alpha/beta hydrolase [Chitinophagaceae bacterium]
MITVFPKALFLLLFFYQGNLYAQRAFIAMSDSTKIYYSLHGKGKDTLFFLHGGPGQNSWGVGPDLLPLAKSHVLIFYDQRGCGLSEQGDTNKLTASRHVQDLEELRQFFHIDKMILVGHSWGCLLASLYTSTYPDHVKRLLLISPAPPTRQLFQQRFAWFAKKDSVGQARLAQLRLQMDTASNPAFICSQIFAINEKLYYANPKNIQRKKGNYCNVPEEALRKQAITARRTLQSLGNYDIIPSLKKISQPSLIIEGAQTPVPVGELYEWAKALPHAKLLFIKKVGHAYPMVEQPKIFFNVVEKFLNGK